MCVEIKTSIFMYLGIPLLLLHIVHTSVCKFHLFSPYAAVNVLQCPVLMSQTLLVHASSW
jgi:hypothetical protein